MGWASRGRENIGQQGIIATCRLAVMIQIKSVPPLPLSYYYNYNLYILCLDFFPFKMKWSRTHVSRQWDEAAWIVRAHRTIFGAV